MAKKVIGIILIVFGGIFLAMALLYGLVFGGLGTAFHMISQNGQDFLNDPTTTTCVGEVVSVGDSSTTIEYTVDNSVSVGGNSTSTIVEYTVDGIVYQVELTMEHYQYPVGTQVTVYYNESDRMSDPGTSGGYLWHSGQCFFRCGDRMHDRACGIWRSISDHWYCFGEIL